MPFCRRDRALKLQAYSGWKDNLIHHMDDAITSLNVRLNYAGIVYGNVACGLGLNID